MRTPLAALMAAVVALLVACSSAAPSAPLPLPPPSELPKSATSHVVVLVMENKSYEQVTTAKGSTYFRKLASRYALPKHIYGIRHPSLPNYLALIGGSTFGITENCTSCHVKARTLPDQLDANGFSWRAYMEGMPKRCFKGAEHELYAKKHNPFMYLDAIVNDPARCANVVPYKRLGADLRDGRLPDFAFITPDLCNDTHDCSIATGDRHLAHIVPAILRELGPRGLLFVTWDEGSDDRGCCGTAAGGRMATVVAGPDVKQGAVASGSRYTHYSILRTIEEAFGVPLLRGAAHAQTKAMGAVLKRSHRGAMRKPRR
jgi:phosphatidylinositol-3-phosphatase